MKEEPVCICSFGCQIWCQQSFQPLFFPHFFSDVFFDCFHLRVEESLVVSVAVEIRDGELLLVGGVRGINRRPVWFGYIASVH